MKYQMLNGPVVEATTNNELVEKLNAISLFGKRDSLVFFMRDTARACRRQRGVQVSTTTIDSFVESLIEHGFLTPIESN